MIAVLRRHAGSPPEDLRRALVADRAGFLGQACVADDATLLLLEAEPIESSLESLQPRLASNSDLVLS
jgi:hypothetical protein